MTPETAIATLVGGHPLATRIAAQHEAHEAWLSVYPSHGSMRHGSPIILNAPVPADMTFLVRVFEIPIGFLTSERWLAEADIRRLHDVRVEGVSALAELLGRFGVAISSLERPWDVEYPL